MDFNISHSHWYYPTLHSGRGKWTSTFHTLINTIQPYTQGEENGLQHFTLSLASSIYNTTMGYFSFVVVVKMGVVEWYSLPLSIHNRSIFVIVIFIYNFMCLVINKKTKRSRNDCCILLMYGYIHLEKNIATLNLRLNNCY